MILSLFPAKSLLFIGSKERISRTVSRNNGKMLPGSRFELPVISPVRRGIGYSFTVLGAFEQAAEGYLIRYHIVPTWPTVLRYAASIALIVAPMTFSLAEQHKLPVLTVSLAMAVLLILSFVGKQRHCEKDFVKLFRKVTTSRSQRS